MTRRASGIALVLTSAAAFGTMALFARRAEAAGLDVPTLMLLRFGIGAAILWLLVAMGRQTVPRGKTLGILILMGAVLYFGQSFTFFSALTRLPAAMTSLLLYLYPVLVLVLSALFLKERITALKVGAMAVALVGAVLTIGPVGSGNAVGIAFGVASAIFYSVYILVGSLPAARAAAIPTTAVVLTSCFLVYGGLGIAQGIKPPTIEAVLWAAGLAVVSVVAVGTFLAGLERIGPVDSSTLSALEPVVSALVGVLFLGESLAALQVLGGLLILAAVVALVRSPAPTTAER